MIFNNLRGKLGKFGGIHQIWGKFGGKQAFPRIRGNTRNSGDTGGSVPNSFIRPNSMKFQGLIRPIFIKYQAFFRPLHAKNQALYRCFCVFSPRHLSNNQSPPHNTGLVINMCPVILNNKPYIYLQQLDNLFI